MTSAQVVKMSVTNNSYSQNYPHPDDHTIQTSCVVMLSYLQCEHPDITRSVFQINEGFSGQENQQGQLHYVTNY